ncbi:MAG: acyl-CoA dehydrogenase family protein [Pseudomonadota bacterium]
MDDAVTVEDLQVPLAPQWGDLREGVARICAAFDDAYWAGLDRESAYPEAFVAALTENGYLAALIPEEFGGSGLPISAGCAILETIHASGGNAAACHAQMYTMGTVLRHGSPEQKAAYLPRIATGELRLQAFGVTEPTTGSDTTQLKTRAERRGNGWVINGQKVWTSRALYSDLMVLLARTTPVEEVARRSEGLSVFLVDMRAARGNGMEIRPIDAMVNHNTTEIYFDDLEIPGDALVGTEGQGLRHILDGMNAERILIAAECIGDARFFLDRATGYARERVVFGRPIGQNQAVQFPLARAHAETEAAALMVAKAAALFDAGQPSGEAANTAKLLASEASWHAGEAAMQTYGGFAFATEYGIERKWRETRLYQTAPISTNLILAYLGQHVLGLPRSY